MTDNVLMQVDARGVATITFDRPDRLNALDAEQVAAFNAAMSVASRDPAVRVVVLQGAGKVFCAGADIRYLQWAAALPFEDNLADGRAFSNMPAVVRAAPKPVVARVQGGAYGGGVSLAAACDIVVAAETARMAITESRFGLTPSIMVPYLLGRIGQRQCRRWCLTAEIMSAAEAQRIGLADVVVPEGALETETDKVVDRLLMNSPGGLAESKECIGAMGRPPIDQTMVERALDVFVRGRASPQAIEGTQAFVEKRPPVFNQAGSTR